jgi:hypothetical protein
MCQIANPIDIAAYDTSRCWITWHDGCILLDGRLVSRFCIDQPPASV